MDHFSGGGLGPSSFSLLSFSFVLFFFSRMETNANGSPTGKESIRKKGSETASTASQGVDLVVLCCDFSLPAAHLPALFSFAGLGGLDLGFPAGVC